MKEKKKPAFRTADLAYVGIGAALIAICSWISIPLTVPFTMQTFAVFFVLSLLGGKRGTASIMVYILLGAIGVPVFAQFSSGIGTLFGTTGGYILGFLLTGVIYHLFTYKTGNRGIIPAVALVIGLAVCYAFGTGWFVFVYTRTSGAVSIGTALAWCVIPFVIPDLVKLGLAVFLAHRINAMLPANVLSENR